MTPQDLRIGNTLNHHGQDVTVMAISTNKATFADLDGLIAFDRTFDSADFPTPIPITEERLLKMGFDSRGNSYWKSVYSEGIGSWDFILEKSTKAEKEYSFGLTRVNYTYQLENLYYCLCGERLEANSK